MKNKVVVKMLVQKNDVRDAHESAAIFSNDDDDHNVLGDSIHDCVKVVIPRPYLALAHAASERDGYDPQNDPSDVDPSANEYKEMVAALQAERDFAESGKRVIAAWKAHDEAMKQRFQSQRR